MKTFLKGFRKMYNRKGVQLEVLLVNFVHIGDKTFTRQDKAADENSEEKTKIYGIFIGTH